MLGPATTRFAARRKHDSGSLVGMNLWFRRELPIHSPLWLNALGIVCAIVSLFAEDLRMTQRMLDLWAFAAVICFGVSGSLILHSLRKKAPTQPQSESK